MVTSVRVGLELLQVGACRHCERIVRRRGALRVTTYPAICALIDHPRHGPILYDTGYAEHFTAATEPFPERLYRWITPYALPDHERLTAQLATRGLRAADIRWCLISHFHADHVAGLRDLPRARFLCMRADYEALRGHGRVAALRKGVLPALLPDDFDTRVEFAEERPLATRPAAWAGLGQAYDLFGDSSLVAFALPGHSPAQMGLALHDAADREVLLCADACWSAETWRAHDLPARVSAAVMHDWRAYRETVARIGALAAALPELAIVPSHCTKSLAAYRGAAAAC